MERFWCLSLLCIVQSAWAQVILTEVMYNPRGSENANEFIEIYNNSASESVSLAGWQIGDQSAVDEIIPHLAGIELQPQQYAVILDPTYFGSSTQYDSLIPSDALILTIADNTLGSGGLSNSTAETIRLLDDNDNVIAQYTYSLGNSDGISDEKIELGDDDTSTNWADALLPDGTPGAANSVAARQTDGGLVHGSLRITPAQLRQGMSAVISVTIRNHGKMLLSDFSVEHELIPTSREFGGRVFLGSTSAPTVLATEDTIQLSLSTPPLPVGRFTLHAFLLVAEDANALNDTLSVPLVVGWQREVVVINEVMFKPASGQPEWLELFNPQSFSIALPDWVIEDEASSKGVITSTSLLPPGVYRVITTSPELPTLFGIADSVVIITDRLPSFNNSGDAVIMRDFSGAVIDSLFYEGDWGESGKSIERIWFDRANQARNWLPSSDPKGGTPGALNSVSPRRRDLGLGQLEFEPSLPAHNQQVDLQAFIHNRGREPMAEFSVSFVYDPTGSHAWEQAEYLGSVPVAQPLLLEDSLLVTLRWRNPPSGRNLVKAEASSTGDVVPANNFVTAVVPVSYAPGTVVINEIYYAPRSEQVEWFELYNRSSTPVNLYHWWWRDSDAELPAEFPAEDFLLAPNAYAVIAAKETIPNLDPNAHLIQADWLTLNNDRDSIILWDFNGGWQDSVRYSQAWGGGSGVSLEKINSRLSSGDSLNWSSCVDLAGSTPGRANSIFAAVVPTATTVSTSPNPFSPDTDGIDDFVIFQINLPVATASVNLRIYDLRGRLVRELLNNRPVGAHYETVWDGMDDLSRPVRSGIYIVYLQAIKAEQGVLLSNKSTVVVARRFE